MSQKKYQHYQVVKGSWLAQIPTHWKMLSGNRVFEQKRQPAAADDEQLSVTQKYGVMPQNLFMAMDDRKVTLALAGTDNFKHVDEGDFVISLRSFEGGIELSQYKGCISPAYTCLRARKPIGEGYYKFTMKSKDFISALQSVTQGIRDGKNISYAEFSKLSIPYPPVEEQTAIASFLDRETAKIDALIAEQQRLIELLQEKRQAVISHAVTKGLNPNAPMKDSGVEWLGEVPEHWEVLPVRRCLEVRNNLRTPIDVATRLEIEGDYPYYGPTGILSYIDRFMVEGEHFLVGEDGDHFLKFERLSMSLITGGKFNVNNHAHLLRGGPSCLTKWGALFFEHRDLAPWLIKQGVGRYKLRKERLMEIPMTIPPLEEQKQIIEFADTQRRRVIQVCEECTEMMGVLQERRSALISAAVTGQIDVRGLATEEEP